MYVDRLAGPDTVNTMPLTTLEAPPSDGEVSRARPRPKTRAPSSRRCARPASTCDEVTEELLRDGIDAFMVPMAKLLDGIEQARGIVTGRPAAIEATCPQEFEQAVAERVWRAADEDVVRRIWQRDGTLWAPAGTPEVADRLGWLDIAEKMARERSPISRRSPARCAPAG